MMFELLKTAEVIVGLLVTGIGFIAGAFLWWDRRMTSRADGRTQVLRERIDTIDRHVVQRLDKIETKIGEIEEEHDRVRNRLGGVEAGLGRVATQEQLGEVRTDIARLGESVRQTSNKVDTLYNAAIRAAERRTT